MQVVSGFVYSDSSASSPAASDTNGAVTVSVLTANGAFASATTGANGYYYAFGPANTLQAGSAIVAYTVTGQSIMYPTSIPLGTLDSPNAAALATAIVSPIHTLNLYGNALTEQSDATIRVLSAFVQK